MASSMRRALLPLALLLALVPAAPAAHGDVTMVTPYSVCPLAEACTPAQMAHGLVAYPSGEPAGLVVIAHGYGHKAESHRGHLAHLAAQGYIGVAMDFRGEGFPLRAGADDTIAATRDILAANHTERLVLYSVSMGTAVAGIVLAELPDVFDQWVDNEGLAMLHETWAGATLLSPSGNPTAVGAVRDIEAECGGSPAAQPECYLARSAAARAPEFSGLTGAVLTHGLNDGLVPYDQGREMVTALRASGIPSEFYTVVRCNGACEGTSLTGHAGQGGRGLAGHGTESNDAHALTALSFQLLDQVLAGTLVPVDAEHVVDGGATLV